MLSNTTPEEKCAAARRLILELESHDRQTFALAMKALGEIEEDVRELRRAEAKRNIEIFTEEEFAAKLKVSASTIARERKAGRIQALKLGQNIVRYSSLQFENAHEIFRTRPKLVGKRRKKAS